MIAVTVTLYLFGVGAFVVFGLINYSFWRDFREGQYRDLAKFFLSGALIWPIAAIQKYVQIIWELNNDD